MLLHQTLQRVLLFAVTVDVMVARDAVIAWLYRVAVITLILSSLSLLCTIPTGALIVCITGQHSI